LEGLVVDISEKIAHGVSCCFVRLPRILRDASPG
jgi:hypothetical protein